MNKIILIGNGFDIAHGLKTSYKDFINWYLKQVYDKSNGHNQNYEDLLLEVIKKYTNNYENRLAEKNAAYRNYYLWFRETAYSKKIKSELLKMILKDDNYKWLDIENIYFQRLIDVYNKKSFEYVEILNSEFEYIRNKLLEYLSIEQSEHQISPNEEIINMLTESVDDDERITMINFNYTNTVSIYKDHCNKYLQKKYESYNSTKADYLKKTDYVKVINIHGQLNSDDEEPIFGIGDEFHQEYKKLKEEMDISEILKFSKSFWYQRNSNYKELLKAIDKKYKTMIDSKKIEIYGHSCGLSDRTLLKFMFEHENISEIKLIHYGGKKGYINSSFEIWRQFDNPEEYRRKFKEYDPQDEMPNLICNNDENN